MRHKEVIFDSDWMLLPEVMKYARASRDVILRAVRDGDLTGYQPRPRATWRFRKEDVDQWLAGMRSA